MIVLGIQLGGTPIGSLALIGRRPQRHGAELDRQPGGDRSGAGEGRRGDGARRGGAREQRASRDSARCAGARLQDATDVDEGGLERPAGASFGRRTEPRAGRDHRRRRRPAWQALVTDAVQMLRIDTGRFTVHRERHELAAIVADTVKQFHPRSTATPSSNRCPPELNVEADRHLLGLALRQLLDNAVKYSPSTSTIKIAATEQRQPSKSTCTTPNRSFPDAEQARIFERFYRGAQATQMPGTGMGLAIVQRIAQAHGGTVRVVSDRAAGTTFTLELPHGGLT